MAHAVQGHPIHWHVDPNIGQEIEHYNARRRKNQAGHGARESLGGEGYKVENRSKYVPYEPESQSDAERYWRRQARDESGRTVVSRTLENAYCQENARSATPDRGGHMKRTMLRNIQRMRAASERNRRARTPSSNPMTSTAPLSDKDMMDMCNGVVAEAKKPQVKKWLATASVSDKERFRQLLVNLRRYDSKHRHVRADILDLRSPERPATAAASHVDERFNSTNHPLKYRDSLESKLSSKLRGYHAELLKSFILEDDDRIGQIPLEKLIEVLNSYSIPISEEEQGVIKLLFENESGLILYREFLATMLPRTAASDRGHTKPTLTTRALEHFDAGEFHEGITLEEIIALLRVKMQLKSGSSALQKMFMRFDIDGNSSVDISEFLQVLHVFGIHVSATKVEELMKIFDPDESGSINYIEFCKRVMEADYAMDEDGAMVFGRGPRPTEQNDRIKPGPPGMYRQKFFVPRKSTTKPNIAIDLVSIVESMRQQLRDYVQQRFGSIRVAMKAMLSSTSGQSGKETRVSLFSFRTFLKSIMISASVKESQALFDFLDRDKDGWLDYNDLVATLGVCARDMSYIEATKIKSNSPLLGNLKTSALTRSYSSYDTLRTNNTNSSSLVHRPESRSSHQRPRTNEEEAGGCGGGSKLTGCDCRPREGQGGCAKAL